MKDCYISLAPDKVHVQQEPGDDWVKLRFAQSDFGNGEDYVELRVPKIGVPVMFDGILAQLRATLPTAISEDELAGLIVPEGHEVEKRADGTVVLKLHMRADDGPRTMSWGMPPDLALRIADSLKRQAS